MMVYKNYYPQDFAQLHRREGKVFSCINRKRKFVEEAIKAIESRRELLKREEETYLNNKHLKLSELRTLLLYKIRTSLNESIITFTIDDKNYKLETIAEDDVLFGKIVGMSNLHYRYVRQNGGYYNNNIVSDSSTLNIKLIDNTDCLERISIIIAVPLKWTKSSLKSLK